MLNSSAPYIALAALVLALALGVVALRLATRLREIQTAQRALLGPHQKRDLAQHALDLEEQVRNLREAVTILTDEVERYRHDLDAALSNMAMVRFDAFRDTGGEQSVSMALLDNYRSGLVVSVIVAREFSRIYVKYLDHGIPDRELAPEEQAAVERAVPRPLARGEVSRTPVSSFPREVQQAIAQAVEAERAALEAAAEEAAAEAQARARQMQLGLDQEQLSRTLAAERHPDLGFDWVEPTASDVAPAAAESGGAPGDLAPGTARAAGAATGLGPAAAKVGESADDSDQSAAEDRPAAEDVGETTAEVGAQTAAADVSVQTAAADGGVQTAAADVSAHGAAADVSARGAAADLRAEATVADASEAAADVGKAAEEKRGAAAPQAQPRAPARADDWLGGEEIEF